MRQLIERVSIECRETNTKLITTSANQNKESHNEEPTRTQSDNEQITLSAEKRERPNGEWS